ncbi:MAG: NTP transferase domain-containing protein [Parcubacteria group bacterium]|nr:NTP transferase domain-containing protein [Parcubacteria group bacterium]
MTTQIIVLAAGKGTRMGGETPKALVPLLGKPLVSYVLNAARASGVCARPVVVVGYEAELVKKTLGGNYEYAFQKEPLGTAHAVMAARAVVEKNRADHVMVFCGDMPGITAETIRNLNAHHLANGAVMTLATAHTPNFRGWRSSFYSYGRLIRGAEGTVIANKESSDCTEAEKKKIKEVNPFFFVFKAEWLWNNIKKIGCENKQKEYYLGDLIAMALAQGEKLAAFPVPLETALGINTQEHLRRIEKVLTR